MSCPPWCNATNATGGVSYNLIFFAIDVVFYIAIGYALLATYKRITLRVKPASTVLSNPEKSL